MTDHASAQAAAAAATLREEADLLRPWRRHGLASLRLYLNFIRLAFLKFLAFRLRYYTGVISYTIFVAGNYYLYSALFGSRGEGAADAVIGGLTLPETITYVGLSWIGRSFYFNSIRPEFI